MRRIAVILSVLLAVNAWGGIGEFDGVNDAVNVTPVIDEVATDIEGAWSFWFEPILDDGNVHVIMELGNSARTTRWLAYLNFGASEDALHFQIRKDVNTQWDWKSNVDFLDNKIGKRVHAVVVQNGVSPKIYIDGVDITSDGSFVTSFNTAKWLKAVITDASSKADIGRLGIGANDSSFPAEIKIYRAQYFPVALAADEVTSLYNSGSNGFPNDGTNVVQRTADWIGAVGYSDGETMTNGTPIVDISGNGLDGSVTNGLTFTTVQGANDEDTVVDYSTNRLDGVAENGVIIAKTGDDWHGEFDGVDDYVDAVLALPLITNDNVGTISAWFNFKGIDTVGASALLSVSDASATSGLSMLVTTNNFVAGLCYNTGAVLWNVQCQASSLTTGGLYHVVITQDGAQEAIYINGVAQVLTPIHPQTDSTAWFNDITSLDTCTLGSLTWASAANDWFWDGDIARSQIFPMALTSNEVSTLYNAGPTGVNATTNSATANWTFTPYPTPIPETKPKGKR